MIQGSQAAVFDIGRDARHALPGARRRLPCTTALVRPPQTGMYVRSFVTGTRGMTLSRRNQGVLDDVDAVVNGGPIMLLVL